MHLILTGNRRHCIFGDHIVHLIQIILILRNQRHQRHQVRLTGTIVTDNLYTLPVALPKLQIFYNFRDYCLNKIIRIHKRLDDILAVIIASELVKLNHISNRLEL